MLLTDIRDVPGHENVAIAVLVALVCGVCWYGAAAWGARQPLPFSYPRAALVKPQDRLPVHAVPTIRYRLDPGIDTAALADLIKSPFPCQTVRQAVAVYGEKQVRAEARRRGYSKKQIDEAMICLTEKKT